MKLWPNIQVRSRHTKFCGFTLVEMMMAVGVFLFIFIGTMVAIQIFGLRVYSLAATKLTATEGGRETLNQLRDQIREAKTVYVGNCSSVGASSFTLIPLTSAQQGNALQIFPTTNLNSYAIYYLNTNDVPTNVLDMAMASITNSSTNFGTPTVLASYITNQMIFDAEDYMGNIATNTSSLDNRLVIKVTMQFSQWEYPIGYVGVGGFNAYDYYQLRTRVFRRAFD
jgi:type II secretory pathway pseudopilin PulG